MTEREEFLLHMYDQLLNDINRHIMVVWQCISVVIAAFAVFALVETHVIEIDIAICLIVLLAAWLLAHLEDASYWYNRNLAMVANIERQFLRTSDLREIHYYFGQHRPDNSMIAHLKIQYAFGVGLIAFLLLYHFFMQVVPGLTAPISNFDTIRTFPYLATVGSGLYVLRRRSKNVGKYTEFLENSPGKNVDTTGIRYGEGHGKPRREHEQVNSD